MLTPTPGARRGARSSRVKAAGVVLADGAGARAPDHAGPLRRPRHRGGRSRARRGRLRRADVRAGDRPADRDLRRPGAGRAVERASSGSAGWRRPSSGFSPASSARSSSSRSRCRGSSCSSAPRVLHAAVFIGLYALLGPAATSGRRTRPSPARRSATPSSASSRSSWSSFCPGRSNAGGRAKGRLRR